VVVVAVGSRKKMKVTRDIIIIIMSTTNMLLRLIYKGIAQQCWQAIAHRAWSPILLQETLLFL
jgi:hypothetical protein